METAEQPLVQADLEELPRTNDEEAGSSSGEHELGGSSTMPLLDDSYHYIAEQRTPFMESPVLFFRERFQAGSVKGSVFTLVVSIVGAGTLSIPYAIAQSGVVLGTLLFVFGAVLVFFSLNLLLISSQHTGAMSYKEIAIRTYGMKMSVVTQLFLLTNLYGTTISYLVAAGKLISTYLQRVTDEDEFWVQKQTIMCLLVVCFITPLSLLRTMGSLRFSSLFGVSCVIYLTVVVVVKYFQFCSTHTEVFSPASDDERIVVQCFWEKQMHHNGTAAPGDVVYDDSPIALFDLSSVLNTIPIVIYAYTCHPNVLPVFLELRAPNRRRMVKVMWRSITVAMFIYVTTGCFGYLTFRNQLNLSNGDFLLNDYKNGPAAILGAIGMSLSMVLAIPLFVHAFRSNLYKLLNPGRQESESSTFVHVSITLGVIVAALIPAVLTSDISAIFTILGATTNPVICYVLPTMFLFRAVPNGTYVQEKTLATLISVTVVALSSTTLIKKFT